MCTLGGLPTTPYSDQNQRMWSPALPLLIDAATGPVLIQPAFAEEPDSVNVGGKSIGADPDAIVRFQMRRDFDERNFCRGAGDLFLFGHVSAMLTRTRPAPSGFIEPCLGGSMPRK